MWIAHGDLAPKTKNGYLQGWTQPKARLAPGEVPKMQSTSRPGSKSNSDLAKAAVAAAMRAIRHAVDVHVGADAGFRKREEVLLELTNEVSRLVLEADLQRRADELTAEALRVDGVLHRRHEEGEVIYHSLCGSLTVRRYTYRQVGIRNGPTVVPLELSASLVEGATPALAFSVAQGIAKMPSRHYEEEMRAAFRVPPSRSTVERMAQRLGGFAKHLVPQIEPEIREAEQLPTGAHAISLGLDRTTAPIIEERPPGQPPTTRRKKRTKPYQRRPPEPFDIVYRMVYVGTFSIVDSDGKAIVTRRYGATPEEGPDELVSRVMADLERARRQNPQLPIVIVQDGASELWGLMWRALRAQGLSKGDWIDVIDRYHLNEHLAAALALVEKDPDRRAEIYANWQHQLDHRDRAIIEIRAWLAERRAQVAKSQRRVFESHIDYILIDRFFRYARLRRAGLPIASGVTEGACKSLITTRFKRSGQRWYQDGLTSVLTLRALHQSDRLDFFWLRMITRYEAKIELAA